ncbi:MAG: hypothetical protein U5K32_05065 [Bacteroidales bacterium]|nr:hypothetical protein [Bacteroidales bacterium]
MRIPIALILLLLLLQLSCTGERKDGDRDSNREDAGGYSSRQDTVTGSRQADTLQAVDKDTSSFDSDTTTGDSPWLNRVEYFGRSFALVNLLIIVIVFSISTMVVLLVFILLNRRRMKKREALYQYLLETYQALIIDYLYGEAGAESFRKIASDRYRRQVLIEQMKDVAVNLKGDSGRSCVSCTWSWDWTATRCGGHTAGDGI